MIMDARSNGLIFIISSFILYLKTTKIKFTRARILSFSLASIIILYTGYVFYVNQVLNNNLGGTNARTQLSLASNPYNPFELLYYGRSQVFISLEAISERPILGYGSWAKDRTGEFARFSAQLSNINYIPNDRYWIPSHSLILTTWLYSGIIGFLALVYLLFNLMKQAFITLKNREMNTLTPILTILTIDMIWNMFFSPFGLLRTSFPIFAALVIVSYRQYQLKKKSAILNQNNFNLLA
jgi:O-antigen ligase